MENAAQLAEELKVAMGRSGLLGSDPYYYYTVDATVLERIYAALVEEAEPPSTPIKLTKPQQKLLKSLEYEASPNPTNWTELLKGEFRSAKILEGYKYLEIGPNDTEVRLTPLGVEVAKRLNFRI